MDTATSTAITKARALREAAKRTRLQLAARAGVSLETLRILEMTGRASEPTLARIAGALGCPPMDIVGLAATKRDRARRGAK